LKISIIRNFKIRMKNHSKNIKIIKHREGQSKSTDDFVAIEEPLEIRIENKSIAIVMRTPGHDQELTAGFLLSEGAIKSLKDIFEISECINQSTNNNETGNYVDVILTNSSNFNFEQLTRHVFTSSSCGVCGKATVESVMMEFEKINSPEKVNPSNIFKLPEKLLLSQETFKKTGGLHASALFDENGEIVVMREDVGRHNALDKVIGYALLNEMLPLKKHTLLLSGRISFELMQKSLAAGIPTVAGISAPSSLAIDFAKKSGQNLIGFLRDQTMNIYS
tara:strand:+ start:9127 stop:9960 length:834 start_codon:yes stop_codon:yes gene_type:complete